MSCFFVVLYVYLLGYLASRRSVESPLGTRKRLMVYPAFVSLIVYVLGYLASRRLVESPLGIHKRRMTYVAFVFLNVCFGLCYISPFG